MTKKGIHMIFLLLLWSLGFSQSKSDSVSVDFHLEFDKSPLQLGKKYISASKDTLAVENFKCYVSNIQIEYEDRTVFIQNNSYHLLDSNNPKSFRLPVTKRNDKPISKITFNIGIDSITNNSGALPDDLDPVKGMYWAWQSGYINMKVEGKSKSCKTRKNEFSFHIGGYLEPYYSMRRIEIPIQKPQATDNQIDIAIDLGRFFSEVNLTKNNSVMIPGTEAMKLADISAKMFYHQ
ncbi:MAG: hypothetical protein QM710_00885 [Flavobacterium sp.]